MKKLLTILAASVVSSLHATTAYVSTGGDDSTGAVDDSTHPYATVSAAVAALGGDGGVVSVAAGEYTETTGGSCITISAPVEVIGATGNPADVVITRGGQYARIFNINNAGAKLKYLTVYGGSTASTTLSSRQGGGVYIGTSGGVVEDCVVSDCVTGSAWNDSGEGGGIYMASSSSARVTRCRILNSTCGNGKSGGAIYMAGNGLVECSLIAGTTGRYGNAVYINGSGKMINCTISGNVDSTAAGVYASSNARVVNCAIFGNQATSDATGHKHVWDGTAARFINCAADVQIAGTDCHTGWAGLSVSGDYTLTSASCGIDGGVDPSSYGITSTTDLAGNNWFFGTAYDCGCFELNQNSLACDFRYSQSAAITSDSNPAVATFTAYPLGVNGSVSYEWDFGDGTPAQVTSDNPVQHNYPVVGTYTVTLRASDNSGTVVSTHTGCVVVAPFDLYVDSGNAGAAFPYDTEETAAADIATAIAAAGDGSVIHVLDGTYSISTCIDVLKAVTIKGESGDPAKAIIDAGNHCRGMYLHNADAKIQFLTITRGKFNGSGGCLQIGTLGGTAEDCVFSYGDVSAVYNGSGGAVYMNDGRLSRCVLKNSKSPGRSDYQSTGAGLTMRGGIAEDCLITENNCKDDCIVHINGNSVLINCTVVANVGTLNAGVAVESDTASVVNCAIFGNTASTDTTGHGAVISCKKDGTIRPARFFNCAWDADIDGTVNCRYVTDPRFKDFVGKDYHISTSSELCDNGTSRATYGCVSTTDLDGHARAVDDVDIGCYENQKDEMDVALSIDSVQPIIPASVALSGSVQGATGSVTYEWTFTNTTVGGVQIKQSSGTQSSYNWSPSAAGVYEITLIATDSTKSLETAPQSVHISVKDVYVKPVNAEAEFPYDSEAKATTSILDAIESVVDGCTIHVLPGEDGNAKYTIASAMSVNKAIEIVGEASCRTNILIDANNGRAAILNNAGAWIKNLWLKGNSGYAGRVVYFEGAGGSISNCCIQMGQGYAVQWGSCGAAMGSNAYITHCEFFGTPKGHLENTHNGAAVHLNSGSRIENSIIRDSTCYYQDANSNVDGGSVMYLNNAVAVNCTIVNCDCQKPSTVSIWTESTAVVSNCVVVGVSNTSVERAPTGGTGTFEHCATDVDTTVFVDYANGDYRPKAGGALVDAGAEVAGWNTITDLAGNPRVKGAAIDIGCYEYQPKSGLRIILR